MNPPSESEKTNPIQTQYKPKQTQFQPNIPPPATKQTQFKANTNPIKANFRKAKMNLNFYLTKDYENERLCRRGENKPNQTQSPRPTSEIIVDSLSCGSRLMAAAGVRLRTGPGVPRTLYLKCKFLSAAVHELAPGTLNSVLKQAGLK